MRAVTLACIDAENSLVFFSLSFGCFSSSSSSAVFLFVFAGSCTWTCVRFDISRKHIGEERILEGKLFFFFRSRFGFAVGSFCVANPLPPFFFCPLPSNALACFHPIPADRVVFPPASFFNPAFAICRLECPSTRQRRQLRRCWSTTRHRPNIRHTRRTDAATNPRRATTPQPRQRRRRRPCLPARRL